VLVWNSVQFAEIVEGLEATTRQGRRPRRPRADLAARERARHLERNLPIPKAARSLE